MAKVRRRNKSWYGWNPDLPDHRDFQPSFRIAKAETLPPLVDLTTRYYLSIFNQGPLGSCTANAIAAAHNFAQQKANHPYPQIVPSRLFIYYNERDIEGSTQIDSGAQIRDGIKCVAAQGACEEKLWPYKISIFKNKPSPACYKVALEHQAIQYERLDNRNLNALLSCLAAGFPFVFGFSVYSSFESSAVEKTGKYQPDPYAEELLGGHAVLAVAYDKAKQVFKVRNSWGSDWGSKGYFTMRFSDVQSTNMCDDFWVIRQTE